jgi:hypothetical protein
MVFHLFHLLSFTGNKVQILTQEARQSSCRLCLRLASLDPRSVLPAFFDANVRFLCWVRLFGVEPPKGPSLIWQLQNWQMFCVCRERIWNSYVKFIWNLSLFTWSLWLVHVKKNRRLKSEENLKSEKDKSRDVKEGSNRKCRGLCARSWLSGNLSKTALRLIEIFRMYFDTSLKTSRRDCSGISCHALVT